ncbi:MAG: M13-type metalloendopeptidase [Bacillota bacterium]|nr:M13-type metalloendopeptidase [Bacillota bacterium]
MFGLKTKVVGILVCLMLIFGILPVQAAGTTGYVTREQAVASLLDSVGYGALDNTESNLKTFTDAGSISPQYTDELGIAVTNGILMGTSGKKLDPKKNVTRLEFAIIVSRTIRDLPNLKPDTPFSDVPASYKGDVERLVRAGLMSGCGNGKFGSKDYLTKDQISAVLARINKLSQVRPQDDFYYSVNRNWLTNTKLPAGYPMLMSFNEVDISNSNKIKTMVNDLAKNAGSWQEGTKEQKITDLYSTIVDAQDRNKEGIDPIKQYLDAFDGVKNVQELLGLCARLETETGINPLFSFSPSVDLKDSTHYSLYGAGLSTILPSNYMLEDNSQVKSLYQGFIAAILKLTGSTDEYALKSAQEIYDFEKTVSGAMLSNDAASKVENVYNPIKVDDLAAMFKEADIRSYLTELGYGSVQNLVISDPGLMKKTGELVSDNYLDVLKAYTRYHFLLNTAPYLSTDLENAMISFSNEFQGVNSSLSDEDKAFNELSSVMSTYLGQMYVEKYFPEQAKKDVTDIVQEIIATFEKRIQNLDWMDNQTKEAAIAKLKAIKLKIGYPDTWEDPLKDISIKSFKDGGSYIGNIFAIGSAVTKYSKTLLNKPVDKSQWAFPPQTVNAGYNATSNEIVIPAGILQAPFYDVNASREQNLGGIGSVIAHEITHAFDNNGAQFDKNGNMTNWWTDKDYATFKQKCQEIVNLYNNLEVTSDAFVNGSLTLSENVADIGGMACILDIAKGMKNANYKELFESNARIWHMTATEKTYQLLTTQDVHSPNKFRVNQVLRNFKEFYDTYGIKPGDAMYLAPEDRITIW